MKLSPVMIKALAAYTISVVRNSDSYDAFRAELDQSPITREDDGFLVAGLKERMDAIETMRNCVGGASPWEKWSLMAILTGHNGPHDSGPLCGFGLEYWT